MTDVFKKHGKRIAREDANIPKPILDVLYPTSVENKTGRFPKVPIRADYSEAPAQEGIIVRRPPRARFPNVSCSSCGEAFGPGDSGFSHCSDHKGLVPTGD
jgi:hypothetical protein